MYEYNYNFRYKKPIETCDDCMMMYRPDRQLNIYHCILNDKMTYADSLDLKDKPAWCKLKLINIYSKR